jgi:hypothetical protein
VGKRFYQLSFLRDTDGEKTKEAVEAALEKYRMYMLTVPDEFLPRVTQHECISLIYRKRGNQKSGLRTRTRRVHGENTPRGESTEQIGTGIDY